jgi:Alw26I/Eco31I/Esp3I family type II restriction m6 adenine DNA methyltransferase
MKSSSVLQPNLFNESPVVLTHHFDIAKDVSFSQNGKNLDERSSGKFYTPKEIALPLIKQIFDSYDVKDHSTVSIIDPFCGDGRLIKWVIEYLSNRDINLEVHLWDYDKYALDIAEKDILSLRKSCKNGFKFTTKKVDSFEEFFNGHEPSYDVVITNPPWEIVKPDPEELAGFPNDYSREIYVNSLRDFSEKLQFSFPLSKPSQMYGGWGVNLARTGTEVSLRLVREGGVAGIVSPASLLADQNSEKLRKWVFDNHHISHLNVFPAELRLFKKVDQPSITLVASRATEKSGLTIEHYSKKGSSVVSVSDITSLLKVTDNKFPLSASVGAEQLHLLQKFSKFKQLSDLDVWLGRELDETGYTKWTKNFGRYKFVKGRNVQRFVCSDSLMYVDEEIKCKLPLSKDSLKIVWRDVSRPTQKRRMVPTLIPPGYVAGNSLGVLTVDDSASEKKILAILGVISSLAFEFQVRANLATSHVSSGVVRKMRVPDLTPELEEILAELVKGRLNGKVENEVKIEILVAKSYSFKKNEFEALLAVFPKLTITERDELLNDMNWSHDK